MRFSSVLISTLAALATAAPNSLARREDQAVTEAIKFAVQADGCEIFQCAGVIASAACIALAISVGGPAAPAGVAACVAGGVGSICPCANCVDSLADFLKNNNICPSD